jgi:hypothetical protein
MRIGSYLGQQFLVNGYTAPHRWKKLQDDWIAQCSFGTELPHFTGIEALNHNIEGKRIARSVESQYFKKPWYRTRQREPAIATPCGELVFLRDIDLGSSSPSVSLLLPDLDFSSEASQLFFVEWESYLSFEHIDTFEARYQRFLDVIGLFVDEITRRGEEGN